MTTKEEVDTLEERKKRAAENVAYKFRDPSELSEAQLTDPDYSKKVIFGPDYDSRLCSKCHHCR